MNKINKNNSRIFGIYRGGGISGLTTRPLNLISKTSQFAILEDTLVYSNLKKSLIGAHILLQEFSETEFLGQQSMFAEDIITGGFAK